MLPGMAPSLASLMLTVAGFVGGVVVWNIVASSGGVWERLRWEPDNIKRLLTRQLSVVVIVTLVLALLSALLGGFAGSMLGWLSTVGGIIFWAYLGALALTAWRGTQIKH